MLLDAVMIELGNFMNNPKDSSFQNCAFRGVIDILVNDFSKGEDRFLSESQTPPPTDANNTIDSITIPVSNEVSLIINMYIPMEWKTTSALNTLLLSLLPKEQSSVKRMFQSISTRNILPQEEKLSDSLMRCVSTMFKEAMLVNGVTTTTVKLIKKFIAISWSHVVLMLTRGMKTILEQYPGYSADAILHGKTFYS
jgi:hypothetical protein